jgi:hypothetical protein
VPYSRELSAVFFRTGLRDRGSNEAGRAPPRGLCPPSLPARPAMSRKPTAREPPTAPPPPQYEEEETASAHGEPEEMEEAEDDQDGYSACGPAGRVRAN